MKDTSGHEREALATILQFVESTRKTYPGVCSDILDMVDVSDSDFTNSVRVLRRRFVALRPDTRKKSRGS